MATLTDVLVETYKILGEPSDSTNYDEQTVVLPRINTVVSRVCKGFIRNLINQQAIKSGDLPFLRKEHFIVRVPKTSLTTDITTASITIETTTTKYSTGGSVLIGTDVIDYTGKNATHLTGVTNIGIAHDSTQSIYQLYPMPANISQNFIMYALESKDNPKEIPYLDSRYPVSGYEYYTILQKTDGTNVIHIKSDRNTNFMMVYYLASTDMEDGADDCVIPDPYALNVIAPLVAGELLRDNEEYDDATGKLNRGYTALIEMYDFYNSAIKKSRQTIQAQQADFSSIRGQYVKRGYRRNSR